MSDDATAQLSAEDSGPPRDLVLALWGKRSAMCELPEHGTIAIGRSNECQLMIDHAAVSRRHAEILVDRGTVRIRDLGSSNGVKVLGRKLGKGETAEIHPGSLVELGNVILLLQRGSAVGVPSDREPTRAGHPAGVLVPVEGPMAQVHRLVEHVAASKITVLLLGETGVGKEIVAESVHRFSPRSKGPFVRLNCAALPEALLESELFGHEKGAFTGAIAAKPGLIESAEGGTLFLDEVGEMPMATQAKLLRVLENREVQRIGSLKPKIVDVRVVAATNVALENAVRDGRFRLDLFHRLNGVSIAIPPLRMRKNEIPELALLFVRRACKEANRPEVAISQAAMDALARHPWPGNVRELKNVMERAIVLARGAQLAPEDLHLGSSNPQPSLEQHDVPAAFRQTTPDPPRRSATPEDAEKQRILDALAKYGGNQSRVAEELGIPRRTLVRRMAEYNLPRPRK